MAATHPFFKAVAEKRALPTPATTSSSSSKKQKLTSTSSKLTAGSFSSSSSKFDEKSCNRPHASDYHSADRLIPHRYKLLDWFEGVREKREMPWRKKFDPTLSKEDRGQRAYEVLVSEIMLQQTQVATVIPYFNRWIAQYPTIETLATTATPESINTLWTGLGYYSRGQRLLQAAQKIHKEYNNVLPSSATELEKNIPGVGPYTAGAISSIAFGKEAALVDGNVNRVFSRVFGIHINPKEKVFVEKMWALAKRLVEKEGLGNGDVKEKMNSPEAWNQALMELGATVCTPVNAACGECPLKEHCNAYSEMTLDALPPQPQDIEDLCSICTPISSDFNAGVKSVSAFPLKEVKAKKRDEDCVVCIVEFRPDDRNRGSSYLIVTRPDKGLLAGMEEFPSVVLPSPASSTKKSHLEQATLDLLSSKLLPNWTPTSLNHKFQHLGSVNHIFSHIKMKYIATHLVITGEKRPKIGTEEDVRCVWKNKEDAKKSSMGTGIKKCAELLWGSSKGKAGDGKRKKEKVEEGDSDAIEEDEEVLEVVDVAEKKEKKKVKTTKVEIEVMVAEKVKEKGKAMVKKGVIVDSDSD